MLGLRKIFILFYSLTIWKNWFTYNEQIYIATLSSYYLPNMETKSRTTSLLIQPLCQLLSPRRHRFIIQSCIRWITRTVRSTLRELCFIESTHLEKKTLKNLIIFKLSEIFDLVYQSNISFHCGRFFSARLSKLRNNLT